MDEHGLDSESFSLQAQLCFVKEWKTRGYSTAGTSWTSLYTKGVVQNSRTTL